MDELCGTIDQQYDLESENDWKYFWWEGIEYSEMDNKYDVCRYTIENGDDVDDGRIFVFFEFTNVDIYIYTDDNSEINDHYDNLHNISIPINESTLYSIDTDSTL